jgi:hypothetical protein
MVPCSLSTKIQAKCRESKHRKKMYGALEDFVMADRKPKEKLASLHNTRTRVQRNRRSTVR